MILTTLGGRNVYLRKTADGHFNSGDGAWKGVSSGAVVAITGPEGWTYSYQNGRLIKASKASGPELKWVYTENRLSAILDETGATVFGLSYDGKSVLPVAWSLNGIQYKLTEQSVPIVAAANGVRGITGYTKSLSGIITPYRWWTYGITLEDRSENYRLIYTDTVTPPQNFVWATDSGLLQADGDYTYAVTPDKAGDPIVARKNPKGETESYFYNAKTGISEHRQFNGDIVRRTYFIAAGPTQYDIRKMVRLRDGKEVDSAQWNYDESGHLIRFTWGSLEKVQTWSKDGVLLSLQETRDGKLLREKIYGDDGQLTKWTEGRQVFEYTREGGKTIMTKFVDGKKAAVSVDDAQGGVSRVFVPNATHGVTELSQIEGGAKTPPELLEQAQRLLYP